jgi:hypothetical protein
MFAKSLLTEAVSTTILAALAEALPPPDKMAF